MIIPTYPARPMNGSRIELATQDIERHDFEVKVNDWRCLIHKPTGRMWNRHGEPFSVAGNFIESFMELSGRLPFNQECEWLDCLAIGRRTKLGAGSLYLLDLVNHPGTYDERRKAIEFCIPVHIHDRKPEPNRAYCLERWINPTIESMREKMDEIKAINAEWQEEYMEGFVKKRAASLYPKQTKDPEKHTPDWIKYRMRY